MDSGREAIASRQGIEVSNGCDARGEGEKDKDLEVGFKASSENSGLSSILPSPQSDYDQAIWRATTLDNSRLDSSGWVKNAATKASKTPRALEAALNTEFEIKWDGPDDPNNPLNWPILKKIFILSSVALQTLMVVFYSTSYLSGSPGMMKEFGIESSTTITLGMTTYMIGLAIGPLVLAPMSELYGRRPVYLVSLFLFLVFVIPACVAKNFTTILVVRFFVALAGSVTLSNAPGSLGDIFKEDQRVLAFSIYFLAPMNGPALGPIIGGFVYQGAGWRWTNWLVLAMAAVLFATSLAIPETYTPVLMRQKAERKRKETGNDRYMSRFCHKDGDVALWRLVRTNLQRPLIMLFTEPICIFWDLYIAAIYGVLYLCFTAYPIVFSQIRGWEPGISGLSFCGISVGTALASALDPVNRRIYKMHRIDPTTGKRPPEARIACVCLGAVLTPAAILWFAWTCVPARIHWIWPLLSGVPFGLGNTFIFLQGSIYLVDSYDVYAASALAGNTVTRCLFGGIIPLFGPKMYANLGPNWAATTFGLITAALIPIPWGFYKWGGKVRMRSPMLLRLQKEKEERGE
ncbi:MFS general substrate transporter [Tuber magnatum]|uniref:MFS general substrate transporter n=1 Tax=Tuber magnatum TaxID=42249 RepID=A0A317STJ3_9PEZI|nr:MFS general substrate transporter [Tuber magnatum]